MEKRAGEGKKTNITNTNIVDINLTRSTIISNVNSLNIPIKRQIVKMNKKQDSTKCL